jgi:hypothetical protein
VSLSAGVLKGQEFKAVCLGMFPFTCAVQAVPVCHPKRLITLQHAYSTKTCRKSISTLEWENCKGKIGSKI